MLNRLRLKSQAEQIAIVQGSAIRLPFGDSSFDTILTAHVFHVIPDTVKLLTEIYRVLKPGGYLIYTYELREKDHIWEAIKAKLPDIPLEISFWKQEDALMHYGLSAPVSHHEHHYSLTYSPQVLLRQIENRRWSITLNMSEKELHQAIDIARAYLLKQYDQLDHPVTVDATFCISVYRLKQDNFLHARI
jgi:SAM-dependent methyltransferase